MTMWGGPRYLRIRQLILYRVNRLICGPRTTTNWKMVYQVIAVSGKSSDDKVDLDMT